MSIIYKPKGRAGEYADLAANLYRGCSNACEYCYAPRIIRVSREEFYKSPEPRENILVRLENSAKAWKGEKKQVLLCFTCDPYQEAERHEYITRRAIEILHKYGFPVCVLTKNPTFALRDLDLFTPDDAFATTLTFYEHRESQKHEPRAELPHQRVIGLAGFSGKGIPTWASLEPVIDADQTIRLIWVTNKFVDLYKVGKLNYQESDIDWGKFANDVIAVLKRLGKEYLIKEDLKEYL